MSIVINTNHIKPEEFPQELSTLVRIYEHRGLTLKAVIPLSYIKKPNWNMEIGLVSIIFE